MCPYTDALQADNLSDAIARHKAAGWAVQYWPTSRGLDVVALRRDDDAVKRGDYGMRQLGTMLVCDKAAQLVKSL